MSDQQNTAFDRTCSAEINGNLTNFVFKRFANKFFIIITQNGKMCNMFTVRFEAEQSDPVMFGEISTATIPLNIIHNFGEDTDEIRSAVQFIVNNSKLKKSSMEILMSVGLKEVNGKCLKEVIRILDTVL